MFNVTAKNFQAEVLNNPMPVIVMFYATWCSKCAMMKPVTEDIAKKYRGQIDFFEINTEKEPALAEQYGADIVPTFAFFKDGILTGILQGLIEENTFEQRINKIFRNS